ncbi:hypothetical protein L6452_34681 [Arctium lappa]|uniref:Uncharacterized protein n=1 Tax=Arctium lappa TaxID=4217 RepID=A0ACB8YI47_ARCLA|nr:hypothetical protein L6452_34681 [Arctium lappa]
MVACYMMSCAPLCVDATILDRLLKPMSMLEFNHKDPSITRFINHQEPRSAVEVRVKLTNHWLLKLQIRPIEEGTILFGAEGLRHALFIDSEHELVGSRESYFSLPDKFPSEAKGSVRYQPSDIAHKAKRPLAPNNTQLSGESYRTTFKPVLFASQEIGLGVKELEDRHAVD